MNETKQTAMQMAIAHYKKLSEEGSNQAYVIAKFLEENFLEIEKEQHGVTFHVGVQWIQYQMDSIHGCLEYWDKEPPEFETWYNETYGGNK